MLSAFGRSHERGGGGGDCPLSADSTSGGGGGLLSAFGRFHEQGGTVRFRPILRAGGGVAVHFRPIKRAGAGGGEGGECCPRACEIQKQGFWTKEGVVNPKPP